MPPPAAGSWSSARPADWLAARAVGGARKPDPEPLGGGSPSGARRDGAAGAPRVGAVPRGALGRRTGCGRLVSGLRVPLGLSFTAASPSPLPPPPWPAP